MDFETETQCADCAEDDDPSVAIAEPRNPGTANVGSDVGRTCDHCGVTSHWGATSWCPGCGFYPRLGSFVEVQRADALDCGQPPQGGAWALLPAWSKLTMAWCLAAAGEAIAVSCWIVDSRSRSSLGACHVIVGCMAALGAHLRAYFLASMADDKTGPLDIFVKPLHVWTPVLRQLPRTQRILNTACVGGILLLAGLGLLAQDFHRLFEIGPHQRRKKILPSPAAALAGAASPEEMELEEAVNEFSGQGTSAAPAARGQADAGQASGRGLEGRSRPSTRQDPEHPAAAARSAAVRETQTCVVIGYQTDRAGKIDVLLLAAQNGRTPDRYLGSLNVQSLPARERSMVLDSLQNAPPPRVDGDWPVEGRWVEPQLDCVVECAGMDANGLMLQPQWKSLEKSTGSEQPAG